jgi:NTP pyrophosphatase (non-canonical NTP hydrolase)
MEPLRLGASLPQIQGYVREMETERGLDRQDIMSASLKLGEEVGELYRAVRKRQGQPQDLEGRNTDVGDEAAHVLILLISIVNRCGISLRLTCQRMRATPQVNDCPSVILLPGNTVVLLPCGNTARRVPGDGGW